MKKYVSLLALFLFFTSIQTAFALDVNVDIKGPQELVTMKDGLTRTITARCLAKNISMGKESPLNISLFQMGDVISLDAVLETKPPKAFHRDLKGTGELSAAIDQMILELFAPSKQAAANTEEIMKAPAPAPAAQTQIKLSFTATSMALSGDTIFVSSRDTLYRIEAGKAKAYWTPPKGVEIFRLYAYKDSILAVTNRKNALHTFLIKDGRTVKTWESCVVPSKDGLLSSRVFTDLDLPDGENKWSKAEAIEGNPGLVPEGKDLLSTLVSDASQAASGDEVLFFNSTGNLAIANGKATLWTSDTKFSTLPLYLVTKEKARHSSDSNRDADIRFYLRPRILAHGKDIIAIENVEGMTKILGNVKFYDSSRILAYSPDEGEFAERELASIRNYYCADIALDKDKVLALVVKKSASFIQRIDL